MSKRILLVIGGIAVVCVLLIAFNLFKPLIFGGGGWGRPPVTISAIEAKPGTWTPGIEAVGTAEAVRGVDIAVEVPGVVKAINFKPNTRAEAGQILIQIDDSVDRADMLAAQAQIKLSESQVQRSEALRKRGATSEASFEDARAQVDVAKSALARLQAVLDQKAIEAPFSGMLGIPQVDIGQYVVAGKIAVTLQDLDRMRVEFTVPEQVAEFVNVGQVTHFGVNASDLGFSGHVIGVDPKVDPQTRLVTVQADLDNPQDRISPGQFLRVRVELPVENNVMILPQTAVVPSLYGDYVYIVAPDDKAQVSDESQRPKMVKQTFVKTGRRDGGLIEVVEGVKPGDIVMSVGQNKVQNGAHVAIAQDTPHQKSADAGATP